MWGKGCLPAAFCKQLARIVLIFTERSDQLSRATDRVPGLPASPGYFGTLRRPASTRDKCSSKLGFDVAFSLLFIHTELRLGIVCHCILQLLLILCINTGDIQQAYYLPVSIRIHIAGLVIVVSGLITSFSCNNFQSFTGTSRAVSGFICRPL